MGLRIAPVSRDPIQTWLNDKYLEWQRQFGRAPEKAFAEWLGIKPSRLNTWVNGTRKPQPEDCDVLAYKLNDFRCYDIMGYTRPDPLLLKLKMEWDQLPEETQVEIGKALEKAGKKRANKGNDAEARLKPVE